MHSLLSKPAEHASMHLSQPQSDCLGHMQGRPGVGKTTVIREMARLLSVGHNRRVVIVDTSNEIGGDGDIAHSGIGRARRMQVLPCFAPHCPIGT